MLNKNAKEDWEFTQLHILSLFELGGDWGKAPDFQDDNYEEAYCIRGSEFRDWEIQRGSTATLRKLKVSSIEKRVLQYGDILVEISGGGPDQPVGRTVVIDNQVLSIFTSKYLVYTNFLRLIRPSSFVNSIFLNLYLKYFYSTGLIKNYQAGSNNLRNLKFQEYLQLSVPLPPLLIQRAIVTKIENLFTSLDKGIEDLKKAQDQLKIYRQSVLKKAFEGELTKEFKSTPQNQTVEEISEKIVDCLHSTPKFKEFGKYCVDTTCIVNGRILWDKIRFVSEDTFIERIRRLKPQKNDVLFAREGTVGTTVILKDDKDICLGQRMMMFRLKQNVKPEYILYFFQSDSFINQYKPLIGGTTSPHLNIRDIKKMIVPICSLQEQQQIVKEIESRLSVCDQVEKTIEESLEKAESLRQSILKKAFEGELLTESELAECKKAPDYEPASILLERIKKEKKK